MLSGINMKIEDVIIVGAGPAGLATAIQLKRYGIQPLLLERAYAGGLLWNANLVENYPGFPRGIAGPKLVKLFCRQAHNINIEVRHEEVIDLNYDQGLYRVRTVQNDYASRVAVLATGTKPLRLTNLSIPEGLAGRIFYEVYDLLKIEGKCVVIIGSGDAAFDYALNLSKKNQVIILNRGAAPKCLPLLWDRAQKVANIVYRNNIDICNLSEGPSGGILVDCQSEAGKLQFHTDYLIGAIGREAQMDCVSESFKQQVTALQELGNLYIIGDVKNGIYRQTSIAVGEGVLAAMKIYRYLKETT